MAKAFTGHLPTSGRLNVSSDWTKISPKFSPISPSSAKKGLIEFEAKDGILFYPAKTSLSQLEIKATGFRPAEPVRSGKKQTINTQPFLAERYIDKSTGKIYVAPIATSNNRYLTYDPIMNPAQGEKLVNRAIQRIMEIEGFDDSRQAEDTMYRSFAKPFMGNDTELKPEHIHELMTTGTVFIPASENWAKDTNTGEPFGVRFAINFSIRGNKPYRAVVAYYDENNQCCNRVMDGLAASFENAIIVAREHGTPLRQSFQGEYSNICQNQKSPTSIELPLH